MNEVKLLGVDIGGSHISVGVIDKEKGKVVSSTLITKFVDSKGSAEEILKSWGDILKEACENYPRNSIRLGVAMPGPFDYENGVCLIKNMNKYDAIYGINIKEYLCDLLNLNPDAIVFRNDAESFLHGEVLYGAAKGYKKAIGITIGTGLGSAVSDNYVTRDVNLGVSPMHNSIAEEYLSTRWFVKRYFELTGRSIIGVKELVEKENDESVQLIFSEFYVNLSSFLLKFIEIERPGVVVVGGNITKAHKMFWDRLSKVITSKFPNVTIKRTDLWENAALMGVTGFFSQKR